MIAKTQYVVRKIILSGHDSMSAARKVLQQQSAVKTVREMVQKKTIEVEYDPCKVGYRMLLTWLQQQGIEVQIGRFSRLRAQWYDYIDTTARENAAAPPAACCNKPPRKH